MVMTIFLSLQKATCGYPRPNLGDILGSRRLQQRKRELLLNSAYHQAKARKTTCSVICKILVNVKPILFE